MAAPRPNGNTRTDQASNFKVYSNTELTRHRMNVNQTEAEAKEAAAASPIDGSMDMTNLVERWGRAIQVSKFKEVLRRLNPNLIFELSKAGSDKYGVYIVQHRYDPITRTHTAQKMFKTGMISGLEFGGIDCGYMPEFSIIVNENVEVPDQDTTKKVKKFTREIRGWRTVLAALVLDQVLTEAQVEKAFNISGGADSSNWKSRVHKSIEVGGK